MKKRITINGAMLLLVSSAAMGAGSLSDSQSTSGEQMSGELFRANELSLDAFGTASVGQQDINRVNGGHINHDARLGAGAGVNYFFMRYIGIGGDAYTENTRHNFVDNASGNLIGRLPLGNSGFAPYIYGGAGHKFDTVNMTFGQAGGGIEYRFTPNIGVFVDARYVFAHKIDNYGVGRAGVRIAF